MCLYVCASWASAGVCLWGVEGKGEAGVSGGTSSKSAVGAGAERAFKASECHLSSAAVLREEEAAACRHFSLAIAMRPGLSIPCRIWNCLDANHFCDVNR